MSFAAGFGAGFGLVTSVGVVFNADFSGFSGVVSSGIGDASVVADGVSVGVFVGVSVGILVLGVCSDKFSVEVSVFSFSGFSEVFKFSEVLSVFVGRSGLRDRLRDILLSSFFWNLTNFIDFL